MTIIPHSAVMLCPVSKCLYPNMTSIHYAYMYDMRTHIRRIMRYPLSCLVVLSVGNVWSSVDGHLTDILARVTHRQATIICYTGH
jgi:hypothetical protein